MWCNDVYTQNTIDQTHEQTRNTAKITHTHRQTDQANTVHEYSVNSFLSFDDVCADAFELYTHAKARHSGEHHLQNPSAIVCATTTTTTLEG